MCPYERQNVCCLLPTPTWLELNSYRKCVCFIAFIPPVVSTWLWVLVSRICPQVCHQSCLTAVVHWTATLHHSKGNEGHFNNYFSLSTIFPTSSIAAIWLVIMTTADAIFPMSFISWACSFRPPSNVARVEIKDKCECIVSNTSSHNRYTASCFIDHSTSNL